MSGSRSPAPPRPRLWSRAARLAADVAVAVPNLPSTSGLDFLNFFRAASLAFIVIAVAGCVETGDFGRPKASLWNDYILPTTGSFSARLRRDPVSSYVYTDDEKELRDRAWRFLTPAHEKSWFLRIVADLARTRVLPIELRPASRTAYHRALLKGSFRSPASRYRRLSEDAVADLMLIAPFAVVAARVMASDDVRLRSVAFVQGLETADVDRALARVAENRCLIAWVGHETYARGESYRYALEHLVIEAPQNEAISAERSLAELEAHRQILDALLPSAPGVLCTATDIELQQEIYAVPTLGGIAPDVEPLVIKD